MGGGGILLPQPSGTSSSGRPNSQQSSLVGAHSPFQPDFDSSTSPTQRHEEQLQESQKKVHWPLKVATLRFSFVILYCSTGFVCCCCCGGGVDMV